MVTIYNRMARGKSMEINGIDGNCPLSSSNRFHIP